MLTTKVMYYPHPFKILLSNDEMTRFRVEIVVVETTVMSSFVWCDTLSLKHLYHRIWQDCRYHFGSLKSSYRINRAFAQAYYLRFFQKFRQEIKKLGCCEEAFYNQYRLDVVGIQKYPLPKGIFEAFAWSQKSRLKELDAKLRRFSARKGG